MLKWLAQRWILVSVVGAIAAFLAFCSIKASAMYAFQHDCAAQGFLRALHPVVIDFLDTHGRWPTKNDIQARDIKNASDGAGGILDSVELETLWAECELLTPSRSQDPVAVIPSTQKYQGEQCSNVLCADGDICTQPLSRYYQEK